LIALRNVDYELGSVDTEVKLVGDEFHFALCIVQEAVFRCDELLAPTIAICGDSEDVPAVLRKSRDGDDLGVGGKAEDGITLWFPGEGIVEEQGPVVDVVDVFPSNEVAVWQRPHCEIVVRDA
jgi:hypothetical protein